MKKLLSLALLVICFNLAHAQTFKPFKVDVSTGYAIPQGDGAKGGLLFVIEPKYAVMDQLSVGLRMEGALTATVAEVNGEEIEGDVKALSSYLATGDYYFSNNKFRPFGGAGLGIFRVAGVSLDENNWEDGNIPTSYSSKFGFMVRGGFEYGHFRMGAEYNFVGDKSGYAGIKLGFCIGGGRLD
jgi:outer membrane protein W